MSNRAVRFIVPTYNTSTQAVELDTRYLNLSTALDDEDFVITESTYPGNKLYGVFDKKSRNVLVSTASLDAYMGQTLICYQKEDVDILEMVSDNQTNKLRTLIVTHNTVMPVYIVTNVFYKDVTATVVPKA